MKNIELRKVPCGETFTAFGEEYVVLDHVDGGVLSIRKGIWKRAPFDRMNNSNLSEANIREDLDDYFQLLKSNGAEDSDLLIQHVDLKATDGTRVYGYLDCTVALLTLEQYGKYKEIIPKVDGAWWLATPVWTRWLRSPVTGNTPPRVARLLQRRLRLLERQQFLRGAPRFDLQLLPLGLLAGWGRRVRTQ